MSMYYVVCACIAFLAVSWSAGAAPVQSPQRLWKPVADDVYLQEIGEKIATDRHVESLAVHGDDLYAVVGGVVMVMRGASLEPANGAPQGVHRLRALGDALWAAPDQGVFRLEAGAWGLADARPFVDFCMHLGTVCGATRDAIFRFENGAFVDAKPEGGYLSSDSTVVMDDFSQVLA
jgi:hypothetical protein